MSRASSTAAAIESRSACARIAARPRGACTSSPSAPRSPPALTAGQVVERGAALAAAPLALEAQAVELALGLPLLFFLVGGNGRHFLELRGVRRQLELVLEVVVEGLRVGGGRLPGCSAARGGSSSSPLSPASPGPRRLPAPTPAAARRGGADRRPHRPSGTRRPARTWRTRARRGPRRLASRRRSRRAARRSRPAAAPRRLRRARRCRRSRARARRAGLAPAPRRAARGRRSPARSRARRRGPARAGGAARGGPSPARRARRASTRARDARARARARARRRLLRGAARRPRAPRALRGSLSPCTSSRSAATRSRSVASERRAITLSAAASISRAASTRRGRSAICTGPGASRSASGQQRLGGERRIERGAELEQADALAHEADHEAAVGIHADHVHVLRRAGERPAQREAQARRIGQRRREAPAQPVFALAHVAIREPAADAALEAVERLDQARLVEGEREPIGRQDVERDARGVGAQARHGAGEDHELEAAARGPRRPAVLGREAAQARHRALEQAAIRGRGQRRREALFGHHGSGKLGQHGVAAAELEGAEGAPQHAEAPAAGGVEAGRRGHDLGAGGLGPQLRCERGEQRVSAGAGAHRDQRAAPGLPGREPEQRERCRHVLRLEPADLACGERGGGALQPAGVDRIAAPGLLAAPAPESASDHVKSSRLPPATSRCSRGWVAAPRLRLKRRPRPARARGRRIRCRARVASPMISTSPR